MLKKGLIGITLGLIFLGGFYTSFLLGQKSVNVPVEQEMNLPNSNTRPGTQRSPEPKDMNSAGQGSIEQNSAKPVKDAIPLSQMPEGQTLVEQQKVEPMSSEVQVVSPSQTQGTSASVAVETVAQAKTLVAHTFYGTVVPYAEANVQSEQGGKITMLKHKEGETVQKGNVIVRFDDSDTRLELEQAVSAKNSAIQKVQQAESDFKTIQTNAERYQKLFQDGFLSKQEVDTINNELESARSTLNSAKETVKQDEASINLKKNSLKDFYITAPINGIIDAKNYNLQEVYKSGDVIYHIVNIDQVYVEVEVPETYIGKIRENMEVTVLFDALDETSFPAVIETILPSGTTENRTFIVKALVNNPDHLIKPSMFARANVNLGNSTPKFTVAKDTLAYGHQ